VELNVKLGKLDGEATVHDPLVGDWVTLRELIARAGANGAAYQVLLEQLNGNRATVTPSSPANCKIAQPDLRAFEKSR